MTEYKKETIIGEQGVDKQQREREMLKEHEVKKGEVLREYEEKHQDIGGGKREHVQTLHTQIPEKHKEPHRVEEHKVVEQMPQGERRTEHHIETGKNSITSVRQDHVIVRNNLNKLLSMGLEDLDYKQRLLNDTIAILSQHDVAEEVVIYPAVKKFDENLFQQSTDQTIRLERALYEIDREYGNNIGGAFFNEKLGNFQELFLAHTRNEETNLLPLLEKELPSDSIDNLNVWFDRTKKMAPTRPHPDGPHSAAGKLITGPAVAVVDWLRDLGRKFTQ